MVQNLSFAASHPMALAGRGRPVVMGEEVELPPKHDSHIAKLCKDIEKLKAVELRALCKELGLKVSGNKADLVLRVQEALVEESAGASVDEQVPSSPPPSGFVWGYDTTLAAEAQSQLEKELALPFQEFVAKEVMKAAESHQIVEKSPAKLKSKVKASLKTQEADKMSRQTTTAAMGDEVAPPPTHDNQIAKLCNDIEKLKVVELRALCKEVGLKVSGKKADLVLRLQGRGK